MTGNGAGPHEPTFEDQLEELGFREQGQTRKGGRIWSLTFNTFLTFTLHDYHEHVVMTWAFALGDYVERRGWVLGSGETSFHELFPSRDVRLPVDIRAVEGEITRTLSTLRIDLGDPGL